MIAIPDAIPATRCSYRAFWRTLCCLENFLHTSCHGCRGWTGFQIVKNDLRSTVGQDRLNSLAILSIVGQQAKQLVVLYVASARLWCWVYSCLLLSCSRLNIFWVSWIKKYLCTNKILPNIMEIWARASIIGNGWMDGWTGQKQQFGVNRKNHSLIQSDPFIA